MKTNFQPKRTSGNTLITILIVMAVMGVTLASYLHLVANQNLSTMRSLHWNAALAVAEAGIEEALTHLNHNLTNRLTEGWEADGDTVRKERKLGRDKIIVNITLTDPPVVTASGYVKHPEREEFLPPRTIRVTGTNDFLWAKGMVAKGIIELNGNNIRTDSFDSGDPTASTGGQYDPAKARDNGDVATNLAVTDALNSWNAEIHGRAATGPGGTVKIGPNGAIGPKSWIDSGKKGIYPGWAKDDMNVFFPDVKAPWTSGAFPVNEVNMIVGGSEYRYVLGGGNYEMGELNLSNKKMLITGDTTLYVKGDISVSGSGGGIYIAPGAKLKIYVAGGSTSISGNGVVNNAGNALNFQYFGLPTNTSISMSGNAAFIGSIYAPNAALTLNGGGSSSTVDFVGASISGSVKMNGHYSFHYDENLGKFGPWRSFVVTEWNEIHWTEL